METLYEIVRKELNLFLREPVKKNNLVQSKKDKRLQFALAQINVSGETWKNTIFMDKNSFRPTKMGA